MFFLVFVVADLGVCLVVCEDVAGCLVDLLDGVGLLCFCVTLLIVVLAYLLCCLIVVICLGLGGFTRYLLSGYGGLL